jgi:hypothetical protein
VELHLGFILYGQSVFEQYLVARKVKYLNSHGCEEAAPHGAPRRCAEEIWRVLPRSETTTEGGRFDGCR